MEVQSLVCSDKGSIQQSEKQTNCVPVRYEYHNAVAELTLSLIRIIIDQGLDPILVKIQLMQRYCNCDAGYLAPTRG
jgi:hypothetical protein